MTNILVTGAEGQLGQCFQAVAKEFPSHNLIFVTKKDLDITKPKSLKKGFDLVPFEGIINCAAYSKVDLAELEKNKAKKINTEGVQNLVSFSEKNKLFLIHFSTDYIFDGKNKLPLKEDHVTKPLNYYAESKLAGEEVLKRASCLNTSIRISWLFSPYGTNFVKKIIKLSNSKKDIQVVNDQSGRPTYGIDLARVILKNITHPDFFSYNCYHYANKGFTTWFNFAKKIIALSGNNCSVKPCSSNEDKTRVKRPGFSILDTSRIENNLSLSIPDWENALQRCLNRM